MGKKRSGPSARGVEISRGKWVNERIRSGSFTTIRRIELPGAGGAVQSAYAPRNGRTQTAGRSKSGCIREATTAGRSGSSSSSSSGRTNRRLQPGYNSHWSLLGLQKEEGGRPLFWRKSKVFTVHQGRHQVMLLRQPESFQRASV
jgi:hypothetical protein